MDYVLPLMSILFNSQRDSYYFAIDPTATEESIEKLAAVIEGYFELGGRQVQFNPMGRETLLAAQKNPGDFPDLMVKVSGYSYRFVDLSKGLQDDIISRTEFDI